MIFLLRELQIALGVTAAIAFATGWLIAHFRAGDRIRRCEAAVREMSEIKEGLESELEDQAPTYRHGSNADLDRELAVQETAIAEMRQELSETSARAGSLEHHLDRTREELKQARAERDQIQTDRRAVQEQLAASRRAHEDLTKRHLRLEAQLRHTDGPAPEAPQTVASILVATAEAADDPTPSPIPATPLHDVAGKREGARLEAMGLLTNLDLVRKCGPRAGLEIVAASTGIPHEQLRKWTGMADLLRLVGMDRRCATVLHEAGIVSVQAMANADAANLAQHLKVRNADPKIANEQRLAEWIRAARSLQPMVEV